MGGDLVRLCKLPTVLHMGMLSCYWIQRPERISGILLKLALCISDKLSAANVYGRSIDKKV